MILGSQPGMDNLFKDFSLSSKAQLPQFPSQGRVVEKTESCQPEPLVRVNVGYYGSSVIKRQSSSSILLLIEMVHSKQIKFFIAPPRSWWTNAFSNRPRAATEALK